MTDGHRHKNACVQEIHSINGLQSTIGNLAAIMLLPLGKSELHLQQDCKFRKIFAPIVIPRGFPTNI